MQESDIDVCFDRPNRVNWQDVKGVVTPIVREIHSVMVCLTSSKAMVLKIVSYLFCIYYLTFQFLLNVR